MNSDASFWISFGNVAENISVCRPPPPSATAPDAGIPSCWTIRRICGSKPMSSMRSASSSTRNLILVSEILPRSIRSHSRPGVATRSAQPRSSAAICGRISAPPYTTTGVIGVDAQNFCASRTIWVASSRVGARMRQRGSERPMRSSGSVRASISMSIWWSTGKRW